MNEAFAPQYLAVEKELGLPREKTNVDGGAIALRPPARRLGRAHHHCTCCTSSSGAARSTASGRACIGGGQGIAVLVEAL